MNITSFKKKILVDGKNVYDLCDLSKQELAEIGQRLEAEIAKQNGTASYFVENKANEELTAKLEIVKEIYDDKVATAKKQEKIRQLNEDNELAKQAAQQQRMEAIKHMSPEELAKLVEKNNKEIAKLSE